jgi:cell fate (sporulation/competence/biofilm development) regulator YmcA (YheA/YmcA/DUF963 family)
METDQEKSDDSSNYYGGLKMDAISRNIQILLSVIKQSDIYKEYQKQEQLISTHPDLKARVDALRATNFRLQNDVFCEELLDKTDQLARDFVELRKIPEVNAYLDAERALCKQVQTICRTLIEGIDINLPEL